MNDSLKTLLIVAVLILIVWNLGAGLYYMLVDKGTTKRTVNALTKRIALSVASDPVRHPGHLHGLDHAARRRPRALTANDSRDGTGRRMAGPRREQLSCP